MIDPATALNLVWGGIVMGSLYALLSVGLTLLFGAASTVNLAHGEFLMLGAYVTYWLFVLLGVEPLLSLMLVGLVCAGIGAVLYLGIFSRVVARRLPTAQVETITLLQTFALLIIMANAAAWAWSPDFRSYAYLMQGVEFLGLSTLLARLAVPVFCIPAVLTIYFVTKKTWFGRGISCVIDDKDAAQLVGVSLRRVYLHCFTLGLATVGMAGTLYSMNFVFTPYIGVEHTMAAFVVIILGGVGSVLGALIGGLLVGIAESTLVYFLAPALKIAIIYSILIIVLLVRPKGLLGKKVG